MTHFVFAKRVRALHAVVALGALVTLSTSPASAVIPPDGTHTVNFFCGTIYAATPGMTDFGVVVGQPYVGNLDLTQELPDNPNQGTTVWDCASTTYGCGTIHMNLPGFVPSQLEGEEDPLVDINGPLMQVSQTGASYNFVASVDNWIVDSGPAYLGAQGGIFGLILCSECGTVNEKNNIAPDFRDAFTSLSGDLAISMTVPGLHGSLEPPGAEQETNMTIERLGGACNNILPATSSWGLLGLVALMVATTIFFAGGRRQAEGH